MFGTKHSKILKLITKDHQILNKWTEYKTLQLKYGNTKLLGNTKHDQVKLVFAVFVSPFLYQTGSTQWVSKLLIHLISTSIWR